MTRVTNGIFVLAMAALLMTAARLRPVRAGAERRADAQRRAGWGCGRRSHHAAHRGTDASGDHRARCPQCQGAPHLRGQGAGGRTQCAGHPAR